VIVVLTRLVRVATHIPVEFIPAPAKGSSSSTLILVRRAATALPSRHFAVVSLHSRLSREFQADAPSLRTLPLVDTTEDGWAILAVSFIRTSSDSKVSSWRA
jgi:hypothetical protein